MSCVSCQLTVAEIEGAIPLQNCSGCLSDLVKHTRRCNVSCPSNAGKLKTTCHGFLDRNDIKWGVSVEDYEEYCLRFGNPDSSEVNDGQRPSTSRGPSDYVHDRYDGDDEENSIVELVTLEELELTESERESGWGQMATHINELVNNYGMSSEQAIRHVDIMPIWLTRLPISCAICLEDVSPPDGIIIKDCLHMFCRNCLVRCIESSQDPEVRCPHRDEESCTSFLKPNEIKSLVSKEEYDRHYVDLSLQEGEKALPNAFHCRTPNCGGFCDSGDEADARRLMIFECPKCSARNCIACKVIHERSCAEYRQGIEDEKRRLRHIEEQKIHAAEDERNRLVQKRNEQLSESMINDQLGQRIFMRCPRCNIPCYKFTGCNHVTCTSCHHQFNWAGREPETFR